jgi:polar amino acid transport system substrate-binding protein
LFKKTILIGLLLLSASLPTAKVVLAGEVSTLVFAVNSPGSPPYAYFDADSQSYQGLVRDFFEFTAGNGLFTADYVDSNRSRSEKFLREAKIDMFLANSKWLKQPEDFIASTTILSHHSFLYSLNEFPLDFLLAKAAGKRICTRSGFVYSGLEDLFNSNVLVRVDSSSQAAMAAMLAKQRCDYAVMNDFNAAVTFSDHSFCGLSIHQSPLATSSVNLVFMMRQDMQNIKILIDEQLQDYISSGKFDASLARHSKGRHFPILPSCEVTSSKISRK